MIPLMLRHQGYDVITSSWTVAAKSDKLIEICYQWGADRFSIVTSATGIARLSLDLSMSSFIKNLELSRTRGDIIVDLQRFC
jgi:hypothetical protein